MDTQIILEWVNAACEKGMAEVLESQNAAFLNKMAKSSGAFAYYFTNVHTRKVMSPEQFAAQFPAQMKELAAIKEEYDNRAKVTESSDRISTLEAKFDKLADMIAKLTEAQKPTEPVKAKGKKTVEPVVEEETEAEETEA